MLLYEYFTIFFGALQHFLHVNLYKIANSENIINLVKKRHDKNEQIFARYLEIHRRLWYHYKKNIHCPYAGQRYTTRCDTMAYCCELAKAEWITFDGAQAPMIRKCFECEDIVKASVQICGLGNFYMYINGVSPSNDLFVPAQSNYEKRDTSQFLYPIYDTMSCRIYYLEYDVADLICTVTLVLK